jgi:hypothetical protein
MKFTPQDYTLFKNKGISEAKIRKQLDHFIAGFPYIRLVRPGIPGDGILQFSAAEQSSLIDLFEKEIRRFSVVKFVPASGAASRMFKRLFELRDTFTPTADSIRKIEAGAGFNSAGYLIRHLPEIAFWNPLKELMEKDHKDPARMITRWELPELIDYILGPEGLNYASLPKGLLMFHNYPEGPRTAAEEHLVEAAAYARNHGGTASIHFTISPEHRTGFNERFRKVVPWYEQQLGVKFPIGFSEQSPSTDIIAVDEDNQPFRNPDGSIFFRPGGHGALLKNLNELDEEIIFIKNIDNIVPDRLKSHTFYYKKLLGGYLLFIRDRIFRFLREADKATLPDTEPVQMAEFATEKLMISLPADFHRLPSTEKQAELIKLVNRPVRVCGMVKNEGEPGGGPFWVNDHTNRVSLQIVESAQVDPGRPEQLAILHQSTHFNPVDIVCCTRDYRGRKFNLEEFVDENTGLISMKSSGGRNLKAQELPGLWNGAMAGWITVFIEVPVITFNPVKTVNDLLRKEHLMEENDPASAEASAGNAMTNDQ